MSDLRIQIRPARASDAAFVFDAWLDSFRLSHAAGPIPMNMYRRVYMDAIRDLYTRPALRVLVACDPDDDDQDIGFIAFEDRETPILHYIYVKSPWRRKRAATMLMAAAGIPTGRAFIYTYKTPIARKLEDHWTGAVFDPLCARFPPKLSGTK